MHSSPVLLWPSCFPAALNFSLQSFHACSVWIELFYLLSWMSLPGPAPHMPSNRGFAPVYRLYSVDYPSKTGTITCCARLAQRLMIYHAMACLLALSVHNGQKTRGSVSLLHRTSLRDREVPHFSPPPNQSLSLFSSLLSVGLSRLSRVCSMWLGGGGHSDLLVTHLPLHVARPDSHVASPARLCSPSLPQHNRLITSPWSTQLSGPGSALVQWQASPTEGHIHT